MGRTIDAVSARESILRVFIFYESLSYTESSERQVTTSVLSLAASIGGILSLFLGVSVLSLFEVIEAFVEFYLLSKS